MNQRIKYLEKANNQLMTANNGLVVNHNDLLKERNQLAEEYGTQIRIWSRDLKKTQDQLGTERVEPYAESTMGRVTLIVRVKERAERLLQQNNEVIATEQRRRSAAQEQANSTWTQLTVLVGFINSVSDHLLQDGQNLGLRELLFMTGDGQYSILIDLEERARQQEAQRQEDVKRLEAQDRKIMELERSLMHLNKDGMLKLRATSPMEASPSRTSRQARQIRRNQRRSSSVIDGKERITPL